jgi:mono/diheme cytochrome c family protein
MSMQTIGNRRAAKDLLVSLFPCLLVSLSALTVGCDLPGKPNPADRIKRPDQVLDFSILYRENCAGCHGADGKLGPAPPLNDPLYLAITPDDKLRAVTAYGRGKYSMPAFKRVDPRKPDPKLVQPGPLTEEQIDVLVKGIRSWGEYDATLRNELIVGAGFGSRAAGKAIFAGACAGCHGKDGKGASHGALNDRAFLALISDETLRRYVITGRPDLGMPNYRDATGRDKDFKSLTAHEIDDLVALLASWR